MDFQPNSENWDISFHVAQLSKGQENDEKTTITLEYLKEVIDERITFEYEIMKGYPPIGSARSPKNHITNGEIFEETLYGTTYVNTLLYDVLTLVISWWDADGNMTYEEFVFPEEPKVTAEGFQAEIEKYVEVNLEETSINKIEIDNNFGTGKEGTGNVIVYLSFNEESDASLAKDMIDVYGDNLSYRFSSRKEVNEITMFWEVPFLKEGENIAKLSATRNGRELIIVDRWYDENIFE